MPERTTDETFLHRALELAREGIGLTSPNPCVGALIVDREGQVVGEGSHRFEAVRHAEVIALERAGERARGDAGKQHRRRRHGAAAAARCAPGAAAPGLGPPEG